MKVVIKTNKGHQIVITSIREKNRPIVISTGDRVALKKLVDPSEGTTRGEDFGQITSIELS